MTRRPAQQPPPKLVWLVISSIGIESACSSEEEAEKDREFVAHKQGMNRRAIVVGPYRAPRAKR